MEVLIFIAVIVALIVVHEFGHFVAAKWTGMRVDEFGLGYPPRAMVIGKMGETEYTLNWLPFGGFVKIYGEEGVGEGSRAFSAKSRLAQALVLVAGVAMNLLFAYVLITGALVAGTPRALSDEELLVAKDATLMVANVLPNSPAALAGLSPGDTILTASAGNKTFSGANPEAFTAFISGGKGATDVLLTVQHEDGRMSISTARPEVGIVPSDPSRAALGVEVAPVGVIPLSFGAALKEGAKLTWGTTVLTAQGLWHFFKGVFTFSADFSQVAGPVGIANVVGHASTQGAGYLFSLMAIISINLALINLIPVPALDGGRLLFVIVEGVTRRRIKPTIARSINAIGFLFLILLMLVITTHDVLRLIG